MLGVESGRHRFLLRTVGIGSVNQSLINLVKAELEQFEPSAIASCLCLFPKTEAAMALAELLLLLQVGLTGAWKELATWAWGEKMEGRHESAAAREGKSCSSRACFYG